MVITTTPSTTTTTTTELRLLIQEIPPSSNTTGNGRTRRSCGSIWGCYSRARSKHRGLVTSSVPPATDDHDFQEFCDTMNAHIHQYDAILWRRKKMVYYQRMFAGCIIGLVVYFIARLIALMHLNSVQSFIDCVLWTIAAITILLVTPPFMNLVLFKTEIDEFTKQQNEIYQIAETTCSDMSHRMSSSPSSPINVTCTLVSKTIHDYIGQYENMEQVQFTTLRTKVQT